MFNKLNYNIESYEYDDLETTNAWDDLICDATTEILETFTNEDWEQLYEELPNKSIIWKKRFYDCLPDIAENDNQIKSLLFLTNTDDPELFALSLAKLVNYDFSNVENIDELYEKAENLLPDIKDKYHRYVVENFLEKKTKAR
jgi:hypothetical protein